MKEKKEQLNKSLAEFNYISGIVSEILQMNGYQDTQSKFAVSIHKLSESIQQYTDEAKKNELNA